MLASIVTMGCYFMSLQKCSYGTIRTVIEVGILQSSHERSNGRTDDCRDRSPFEFLKKNSPPFLDFLHTAHSTQHTAHSHTVPLGTKRLKLIIVECNYCQLIAIVSIIRHHNTTTGTELRIY